MTKKGTQRKILISEGYIPKLRSFITSLLTYELYSALQLNKNETVPYFFLLNQNLTWDCLLISVFLPEFDWSEPKIVLFWCSEQFYVPIRQIQSNLGKNTEINKQSHVKFWFNRKNMELSHIFLAVSYTSHVQMCFVM